MTNAQSKISQNTNNSTDTNKIVINEETIINEISNTINNKTNYDSREFQGEKIEGFRKQGEYGPKKFIKP
jgi:hypothetical protein